MKNETLNDLLLEELKDIYDAEHQLTQALPKMAEAASAVELKTAFEKHLRQTEGHIRRLEQSFEALGEKAERKTCKAMKGLLAEGDEVMKDHKGSPVLDSALIGAAQRVEHYEMAAYGTSRAFAQALGNKDVAGWLQKTLDEEKATDQALTELGEPINAECAKASKPTK